MAAFRRGRVRATGFERYHCSGRPVFNAELAQNVLDVFANGAGLRAENDADIVIAFAL